MSVLDDLKMIHDRDKQDALGVAEKQWQQLGHRFNVPKQNADITEVVYAGMGGSPLGAELYKTWPGCNVPFEIVRDYSIPSYVGTKTLFIATSYSGNTEETISALEAALAKNANIVVMSSGGELERIAKEKSLIFVQLPTITQPRYGALYLLKAQAEIMEAFDLASTEIVAQLENEADVLKEITARFRADVPTDKNPAKLMALELAGSSPVIYASRQLRSVAYKWKISFNENAKNVAWWNEYPEFNHNEFLGWTSHPIDKPYKIVDLRSSLDHPHITKRFEVSDRMLSGKRPAAKVIQLEGETLLQQMLYGVAYGDFVSLYVALLNGLDPSPVDIISKLKAALKDD